jgi:hypothetical protein
MVPIASRVNMENALNVKKEQYSQMMEFAIQRTFLIA